MKATLKLLACPMRWRLLLVLATLLTASGCQNLEETISAGVRHTCGLTTEGAAYCWGGNHYGRLGDGTTTHRAQLAAVVSGLTFK